MFRNKSPESYEFIRIDLYHLYESFKAINKEQEANFFAQADMAYMKLNRASEYGWEIKCAILRESNLPGLMIETITLQRPSDNPFFGIPPFKNTKAPKHLVLWRFSGNLY